jgi:hypothetical protein
LTWPNPPYVRLDFQYKQGAPPWRTPVHDPVQFGSGFIIIAQQPGLNITHLRYTQTSGPWLTASGGVLSNFNHPVPYTA